MWSYGFKTICHYWSRNVLGRPKDNLNKHTVYMIDLLPLLSGYSFHDEQLPKPCNVKILDYGCQGSTDPG